MSKYIDAEKLKAEIDKLHDAPVPKHDQQCDFSDGYSWGLSDIENLIDSLQQEQPESLKGKFVFPNFLYARTVDNKTIDMSYAPQSLDAIEYIRKDIVDETIKTAEDHAYFAGQEKFREKLIEWAKENIDSLGRLSYGELIDKLNSL